MIVMIAMICGNAVLRCASGSAQRRYCSYKNIVAIFRLLLLLKAYAHCSTQLQHADQQAK